METYREIHALYDRETIVVYQAYNDAIADAAIEAGRFVEPFSMRRMTWVKPSFLWMMERSGWGRKSNQTRVLAIRMLRSCWEEALGMGVLTSLTPKVHASAEQWRKDFAAAAVHVQWDPERSIHGKKLDYRAIQVGIGRRVIEDYVQSWVTKIEDVTPLVRKIYHLKLAGQTSKAKSLLPRERVYEVGPEIGDGLGIGD